MNQTLPNLIFNSSASHVDGADRTLGVSRYTLMNWMIVDSMENTIKVLQYWTMMEVCLSYLPISSPMERGLPKVMQFSRARGSYLCTACECRPASGLKDFEHSSPGILGYFLPMSREKETSMCGRSSWTTCWGEKATWWGFANGKNDDSQVLGVGVIQFCAAHGNWVERWSGIVVFHVWDSRGNWPARWSGVFK